MSNLGCWSKKDAEQAISVVSFISSTGRRPCELLLRLSLTIFQNSSPLTLLDMNVPWGILHRTDVGIFDPSKNIAAVTKNRT